MADYLVHHGVKGMKWGKRKSRLAAKVTDERAVSKARRSAEYILEKSVAEAGAEHYLRAGKIYADAAIVAFKKGDYASAKRYSRNAVTLGRKAAENTLERLKSNTIG